MDARLLGQSRLAQSDHVEDAHQLRFAAPDRANAIIVDAVAQYKDFWKYSKDIADFSVKTQKELGLIGNCPDKTVGNFDFVRLQKYLDAMVKTGAFKGIPAGFDIKTQYTNEFINPKIGFK